nr:MAG: putative ATPase of the ABC class [Bacteriophage sp.]
MPFAKSRSRPDRSQRKAKLHKRIVFTNYAVPTGALDSKATDSILSLFNQINEDGQTILMVTHSIKAASHAKRVLFIKDGEVFHQLYRGDMSIEELYAKISDTLTILTTGGERHE